MAWDTGGLCKAEVSMGAPSSCLAPQGSSCDRFLDGG